MDDLPEVTIMVIEEVWKVWKVRGQRGAVSIAQKTADHIAFFEVLGKPDARPPPHKPEPPIGHMEIYPKR